ncbi:MAG: 30S ribosome-binding factor RbfA [Thermodesulfobacteriota bacterium]
MKTYPRSSRIGKNIQRGISEYLRNNLRDPRIRMVTITGVTMSPDLSVAYIYYNVNGGERERKDARAGFRRASGFIRKSLAAGLKMKYMPDLRFTYDQSLDYGMSVDRLLEEIKSEHVPGNE